jgi:hypothetical protein
MDQSQRGKGLRTAPLPDVDGMLDDGRGLCVRDDLNHRVLEAPQRL